MERVPKKIANYGEQRFGYVKYDRTVPRKRTIPGLSGFLETEYVVYIEQFYLGMVRRYYTQFDIIDRLFQADEELPKIPIILSKKQPSKQYILDNDYIASRIEDYIDRAGGTDWFRHENIKRILDDNVLYDQILGSYHKDGCPYWVETCFQFEDGSRPFIEIYYLNTDCPNEDDYKAEMSNCLAHEYFHFLHDCFAHKTFKQRSKYGTVVKEPLADFNAVLYTLFRYSQTKDLSLRQYAESRYELWKDRFDMSWPYAKALHFYEVNNRCYPFSDNCKDYENWGSVDKAFCVLNKSRDSMKDAYSLLIKQ